MSARITGHVTVECRRCKENRVVPIIETLLSDLEDEVNDCLGDFGWDDGYCPTCAKDSNEEVDGDFRMRKDKE